MYGYGYPYGFYVDPTYVLLIIGMVLALAASGKMKSTFARYQQVRSHSGLTGAQTAQRLSAEYADDGQFEGYRSL